RRGSFALLLLFGAIWVGYEASIVAQLPYVGHADYADNAVVARNLVAGRGWLVDYVTQFYRLYDGVTRPQETWPLLQPLWIAPFFALFGPVAWAAKLPNLLFVVALAALIYAAGAHLWDRRVGLTAALIILTNYLFFRLVIYSTSDLAFVVFSLGAIYLLYRATDDGQRSNVRTFKRSNVYLSGSSALTGLMLLQKPASGGLIALGMGLWLIRFWVMDYGFWMSERQSKTQNLKSKILPVVLWGAIALAILSPYLARNLWLFGTPFYSTESYDAWIIEYTDWDQIYSVYSLKSNPDRDELPNRSWILRWGFDRTQLKMSTQVRAIRDYLVPPWKDLPLRLSDTLCGAYCDPLHDPKDPRLLFAMGAWLALLGALGAIHSKRRLIALLLAAFGPYTLFLVVYWHANEERYFVLLLPWLALLAAYALWRGYDRVAAIGDGRWAPVGLALVLTALALVVRPSWPDIAQKVQVEPQVLAADLDAQAWLREHTAPGDVIMTRVPWQLNWQSERPALMIPNTTDPDLLLRIARHYNARYLMLDSQQRPDPAVRQMLDALVADPRPNYRFQAVYSASYQVDGRGDIMTIVYRFPES
ncbi:MAG TPA: glycosyltransferase family 39 protein, partial [Roseiflexaceae bacterium]